MINVIEEKKVLRRTVVFLLPTKRQYKVRHLLRQFIHLRLDERVVGIIIIQQLQSIANTKIHLQLGVEKISIKIRLEARESGA